MAFKTYTMPNGRKLTFVSEKAMRQYFADLAREETRKAQGKTIVRKAGQAQLDPVTLEPIVKAKIDTFRVGHMSTICKRFGVS